eukprot:s2116_g2.t1
MPSTRGFHARGLFSFGSSAESPQAMWKPQQAIARLPALPSCAVVAPLFHLEPQSKTSPTSKCACPRDGGCSILFQSHLELECFEIGSCLVDIPDPFTV